MARPNDKDRILLYQFQCSTCKRSMFMDQGTSFREASCKYCNGRAEYTGPAYAEIMDADSVNPDPPSSDEEKSNTVEVDECCKWHNFSRGIPGMGPDAPTYTTATGGRHSDTGYRFDLIDPKAMFVMAGILERGAKKYGADNWRSITVGDNINHAMAHLTAKLNGDDGDDHLGDAFCRTMFALGVHLQGGPLRGATLDSIGQAIYENRRARARDDHDRHMNRSPHDSYELPELRGKGI